MLASPLLPPLLLAASLSVVSLHVGRQFTGLQTAAAAADVYDCSVCLPCVPDVFDCRV